MSAPKLGLVVAPRARRDLRSALVYSDVQWGREQRRRYRDTINRALETLRVHPELGRRRDEIFPGCRTFPVGQHLICYRADSSEIVVARILHAHRDVAEAEFDLPPPESGR